MITGSATQLWNNFRQHRTLEGANTQAMEAKFSDLVAGARVDLFETLGSLDGGPMDKDNVKGSVTLNQSGITSKTTYAGTSRSGSMEDETVVHDPATQEAATRLTTFTEFRENEILTLVVRESKYEGDDARAYVISRNGGKSFMMETSSSV